MTSEQLNLIVDAMNNLSTHLDNITTVLFLIMVTLCIIVFIKV